MARADQHVLPVAGKWCIKGSGRGRAVTVFKTKREAIDAALRLARTKGVHAVVHGSKGQIIFGAAVPSRLSDRKIRRTIRVLEDTSSPREGSRRVSDVVRVARTRA